MSQSAGNEMIFLLGENLSRDAEAQVGYLLEGLKRRLPQVSKLQLPAPDDEWEERILAAACVVGVGQVPPQALEIARSHRIPLIYWLIDSPSNNGQFFAQLQEISAAATAIAIPSTKERLPPAELTLTPQVPIGWGVPAAREERLNHQRLEILHCADVAAASHAELLRRIEGADVVIAGANRLPVLEALARGKCVAIQRSHPFAEHIVDGVNGILLSEDDPHAIEQEIVQKTGERLAAIAAVARYTWHLEFQIDHLCERVVALVDQAQRGVFHRERDDRSYKTWIARFDTLDAGERAVIRRRVRALLRQPLISVVLPVFNPDLPLLREAMDSVRRQIYQRWELCIADDASTDVEVRPFLEQCALEDKRIKVVFRRKNGHISACSNSALELATGEWIALLDQDDLLPEQALAIAAITINQVPNAGLLYSDEDKLDETGERCRPYFKSDWNPELLLGQNCISHLGIYRHSLLREIRGFREGFEGSQDYDLALRCVERLRDEQIVHIPRVLYHWRMIEGSVAQDAEAKLYARGAARRAIADFLQRNRISGSVTACAQNAEWHRVIYELPEPLPLVSIIIPTRDHLDLLQRCIESVTEVTDYSSLEIIIVDNNSIEPETLSYLARLETEKKARVVQSLGEFNFSRSINEGARVGRGEVLLLLNNDIEATEPGWLREMVSHVVRPEVGAVGARLWFPDGTLQHGGVVVGLGGVASHAFYHFPPDSIAPLNRTFVLAQNYSAVTAACLAVGKSVFESVGGFNEELPANFNDVDFCLRLRARGWRIVWTPYANLIHDQSASRGETSGMPTRRLGRELKWMSRKWGGKLLCDPYYSPNLSAVLPGYELAFPPRLIPFQQECPDAASVNSCVG